MLIQKIIPVLFLGLFIFLNTTWIYADQPNSQLSENEILLKQQVKVLEAQLDEMKRANSSLLNAVYATCGTCGGILIVVLLAVLGVNIYNYRTALERIKKEVSNSIYTEMIKNVNNAEIHIREYIDRDIRPLLSEAILKMNERFNLLSTQLMRQNISILFKNALEMDAAKNYDSEIYTLNTIILLAKDIDYKSGVSTALDWITRTLKCKGEVSVELSRQINETIKDLAPEYHTAVENLKKLLSELMSKQ